MLCILLGTISNSVELFSLIPIEEFNHGSNIMHCAAVEMQKDLQGYAAAFIKHRKLNSLEADPCQTTVALKQFSKRAVWRTSWFADV